MKYLISHHSIEEIFDIRQPDGLEVIIDSFNLWFLASSQGLQMFLHIRVQWLDSIFDQTSQIVLFPHTELVINDSHFESSHIGINSFTFEILDG